MSLMTHQDFQVYTIIINHSYKRIFAYSTFTGMWVQAIGLFAQATCAPEFGLPRPFNHKLLMLHIWWGCRKMTSKSKKKSPK